jgi:hypothetical protein
MVFKRASTPYREPMIRKARCRVKEKTGIDNNGDA